MKTYKPIPCDRPRPAERPQDTDAPHCFIPGCTQPVAARGVCFYHAMVMLAPNACRDAATGELLPERGM